MCNDFESLDPYFDSSQAYIYPQPNPDAYEDWGLTEEDRQRLIEQNLENVASRVEAGDVVGRVATSQLVKVYI